MFCRTATAKTGVIAYFPRGVRNYSRNDCPWW